MEDTSSLTWVNDPSSQLIILEVVKYHTGSEAMSVLFSMLCQLSIVFYTRVCDVCGFPSITNRRCVFFFFRLKLLTSAY